MVATRTTAAAAAAAAVTVAVAVAVVVVVVVVVVKKKLVWSVWIESGVETPELAGGGESSRISPNAKNCDGIIRKKNG